MIDGSVLVVVGAIVTALVVLVGHLYVRMGRLERSNRKLWAWSRALLDLYYRHRAPGSPDPAPLPDDD